MSLSILRMKSAKVRRRYDRHAGKILLAGLIGIAWYNLHTWKRDKAILQRIAPSAPLPPLENWSELPMVSVLVAAWKEEENIQQLIDNFLQLHYPNKELVLCAGGEDLTHPIASKSSSSQIIVLRQYPGEGKQHALQRCLQYASGQIIYLTDADCVLNSNSFEFLIYPLITSANIASTGISRPRDDQLDNQFVRNQWAPQRYSEIHNFSMYSPGLLGRNCAIKRFAIEKAWNMDEAVFSGTDYFIALRLRNSGYRILNVPQSNIETSFPESFSHYVNQQSRWLKNLLFLGYRYRDKFHVRHALITSFSGISLLAMPILPLLIGNFGFVTWIISWAAVIFNRVRYLKILNYINGERKPIISSHLFKVLFGDWIAWASLLLNLVNRERREKW